MASTGTGLLRQPPAMTVIVHIALVLLVRQQGVDAERAEARSILGVDRLTAPALPPDATGDVPANSPESSGNEPCSDLGCNVGSSSGGTMAMALQDLAIIGISIASAAPFFCVLLICCIRRSKTRNALPRFKARVRGEDNSLQPSQIRAFLPQQLRKATRNYHDDNRLGRGAFGSVYKGMLHDGQEVAVKILADPNQKHADSQFEAEVRTISSVRHRNLIRLIGYCIDGREKYLVYEYLENRSLDKHLFTIEGQRMSTLSWNIRRQIIQGTANGLSYLHHDLHNRIVHRDIKAANILLDKGKEPKIADFGLARLFPSDQTHHSTMVAGTLGYLAPEVFRDGHVTQRSDTYSFGVVILEILSGRRIIVASLPSERRNLLDWAWVLYERDRQTDLMDPLVDEGEYTRAEVNELIWLALMCTQTLPERRLTMREVVLFLEKKRDRGVMGIPMKPEHAIPIVSDESR